MLITKKNLKKKTAETKINYKLKRKNQMICRLILEMNLESLIVASILN